MFHNSSDSLPGSLQKFYVHRNGRKFGPYWCRMWREGGKLRRQYIKAEDLDRVRTAIDRYRSESQNEPMTGAIRSSRFRFKWNYIAEVCPEILEIREYALQTRNEIAK